jgi:hypothetical protein
MDNYTYIYRDEAGTPYYVGKGINRRCFGRHSVPTPPPDRIEIFEQPSAEAAYEHERSLVQLYGRLDLGTGTLMNETDGGAGCPNPNEESREGMRHGGKISGPIQGQKNAESGHMAALGKVQGKLNGPVQGRLQGQKNVESGHMDRMRTPEACSKGGRISGRLSVENGRMEKMRTLESLSKGGKISGRKNVESGHLAFIRTKESCSKGGRKNVENGHMAIVQAMGVHTYWHVRRGIVNPNCSLCRAQ